MRINSQPLTVKTPANHTQAKVTTGAGEQAAPDTAAAKLTPGQVISGRVISQTPDGGVVVQIDSGIFRARTLTPLAMGQLTFEVLPDGRSLTPLPADEGVLSLLRLMLPLLTKADNPLTAAVNLPESMSYTIGQTPEPLQLTAQMAAVNQGKAGLAEFIKTSVPLKNMPPDILLLARILEAHGRINSGRVDDSAPTHKPGSPDVALPGQPVRQSPNNFLLFPVFFQGNNGWGEWLFSFEGQNSKDQDKDGGYGLSFYLTMSRLGDVHLDLRRQGQNLRGVFSLSNKGAADFLRAHLPELQEILSPLFKQTNLQCVSRETNLMCRLKDDLIDKTSLGNRPMALLDLKV
ncbi:MAG: flagellar hook-length control protein FliK [Deltaproteobacteria bacterium]|nr:flagellar hook-length control protein FliK [Deltaproteobacteria bacterium]